MSRLPSLRRLAVPTLVWLVAIVATANADGQNAGLFSGIEQKGVPAAQSDPLTMRRRLVAIDFEMLREARAAAIRRGGASATLKLNLFDDAEFTGIVENVEATSSGYALLGRIRGVELGTMALVVNGEVVAGTVRVPGATYQIRSDGKGLYAVSQVDLSKLPRGAEPVNLPTRVPSAVPSPR